MSPQVHERTRGLISPVELNHFAIPDGETLVPKENRQVFQVQLQQALKAVLSYIEWRNSEAEFWNWIDTLTQQMPQFEEFELFKKTVEETISRQCGFGDSFLLPAPVLWRDSSSGLATATAEMKRQLARGQKDLDRERRQIADTLLELGSQYKPATFMP